MKYRSLSDLSHILPEKEKSHSSSAANNIHPSGAHDGKGKSVSVLLDTGGRKGKTVTLIKGFQHNPQTMEEISRILKQACGAGGTVKGTVIEIQGDQRTRIVEMLSKMNYLVTSK